MGIYANHGVEYIVKCKDGGRVVIAPMTDTDARLLASRFFSSRKDYWLSVQTMYSGAFERNIHDGDFDIYLTPTEKNFLDDILLRYEGEVAEHGWYDINMISSSH